MKVLVKEDKQDVATHPYLLWQDGCDFSTLRRKEHADNRRKTSYSYAHLITNFYSNSDDKTYLKLICNFSLWAGC